MGIEDKSFELLGGHKAVYLSDAKAIEEERDGFKDKALDKFVEYETEIDRLKAELAKARAMLEKTDCYHCEGWKEANHD